MVYFYVILLATYQVFYGQIALCISDGILQALLAKSLVIYFGGEQLFWRETIILSLNALRKKNKEALPKSSHQCSGSV